METRNFLEEKLPKSHKKRIQAQLMKMLIKGYRPDPRSIRFFLQYDFVKKSIDKDGYELTDKGIFFLNYRYKKTVSERFFDKVKKTESCWLWQAHKNHKGYGMFHYKKEMSAHKFSYMLHKGNVPEGMYVCHSCDTPACVNPEHLWLGTNDDNQKDSTLKGRRKLFSTRGSNVGTAKLNEEKVRQIKILIKQGKSNSQIAKEFNISPQTIHAIAKRGYWDHVKID